MKLFSKRETIAQNMALMAMMAAINIIISVISSLVPIISIFLVLILPLASTLVEMYCKDRYYPIYALATIGLSLVATLWNIETTIFYVVPSIFTGYIFGLMSKKKIPSIYSILCASLIQMGVTLAFIPLINFVFQVNIIDTFKKFFNLTSSANVDIIIPAFVFVISMIQITLSYIIISNEIRKLGYIELDKDKYHWIYELALMIISILTIALSFISLETSYILLMIAIYLSIFIIVDYIKQKYWRILIVFLFGIFINIIVFASAYPLMNRQSGLLLIVVTPFWISFISTLVSFLKREKKDIEY